MSINLTQPASASADPRSSYLVALSVAEQIISASPVMPNSVTASRYGEWDGKYGLMLHLASPSDVAVFARWIGAHVVNIAHPEGKYPFEAAATGVWHGCPFRAWVLHTDAAWVQRQQDKAGELAAQAHDMYDLNADSAHVVPGCAPYGCLAAAADAEVTA
ncbi:hypothetical protein ACGFWI_00950 [Streptomyces sp. NPDC048434]|uniref:hypothetical protein n=1 Tax=Streptomyces sp. NPDC048434 TaxID=3365549 RepID=UPI003721791A